MTRIRLRVNSYGWFWYWMTFHAAYWPPIREVWVGPAETAQDAYDSAKLHRSCHLTSEQGRVIEP